MMTRRSFLLSLGLFALASSTALKAVRAAAPILTLKGKGLRDGGSLGFDRDALSALPRTSFRTATPWHKNPVEFAGVSLKDLLAATGAEGSEVQLVALNDYIVKARVADLIEGEALLATHQDGRELEISDKGPIFLVFPFDSRSELKHQSYYSRAVWQLCEIDID